MAVLTALSGASINSLPRHAVRKNNQSIITTRKNFSTARANISRIGFPARASASEVNQLEPRLQELAERGLRLPSYDAAIVSQRATELKELMGSAATAATDSEIEWFIKMRKLDVEEAKPRLERYLQWRDSGFRNLSRMDPIILDEASTGKAYLRDQPDVLGRPVVVVKVPLQIVKERNLEATKQLCVCLMDEALERLEQSDSETVMCVFDLRGFGPKNADIPFLTFFVDVMFKYYPKRISQVLLIDPPFVFQPVWQVVKPLLGKYSSLVRFSNQKELEEFLGPNCSL